MIYIYEEQATCTNHISCWLPMRATATASARISRGISGRLLSNLNGHLWNEYQIRFIEVIGSIMN